MPCIFLLCQRRILSYNGPMEEIREKKGIPCALRWGTFLLSLLWIGFYFAFRDRKEWMDALCRSAVRPWHRTASVLSDAAPFSVAEVLGFALAALVLTALGIFVRRAAGHRLRQGESGRWALTAVSLAVLLFALFCLWWGVYYYAPSFSEQSGITAQLVSVEELESVTRYFAALCNEYAQQVPRDGQGLYAGDTEAIFAHSPVLYREVSAKFPCLDGPEVHAKPVKASVILSYVNCTGFFCPYTGEANLNTHMLPTMLPATIAHELAHQRGVAAEDEANFVGILACLENGQEDYVYSAAVMAYIYLGNALYRADYERWKAVYDSLDESVRRDLRAHNTYWKRFETPVKEISDKVYSAFLETYGDDRGLQSYGACVDLLVAYYGEAASEAVPFGDFSP